MGDASSVHLAQPLVAHPALPLLVAAVLVTVLPRRIASAVLLAAPLASMALIVAGRGGTGPSIMLYGTTLAPLRLDGLAVPFAGVFALAAFLALLFGVGVSTPAERASGLVTAAAAIGVAVAGDLVTLFVWWELKAVASTVVVLAAGHDASRRAGLRFLYAHLAGGGALLAGIAWHLAATGDATFTALDVSAATSLIAVGFLLSAAAPPLHAWLPDAYPAASVAGSVLLSAFTTKAAVYALARGFAGVEVLLWLGVAMALYGVVYAMVQDDLRRLLSYHIVSQVGFMVAAVGLGTADAINGATAHAVAHVVYKGLLLMGVGVVVHATGRDRASDLGGLARLLPGALVLYVVGALSISGVPLLSGFVSKELTIHALGDGGRDLAVVGLKLAAVGTLLSTLGKLPYATWVAAPRGGRPPTLVRRPPATMYAAMGLAAALCVAIGLVPGLLWDQLPFPNDYTPFTAGKLLETVQLLGVAGAGFWLLRHRLAPHPGTVLDVDAPLRLLPARRRVATAVAPPTPVASSVPATSAPARSVPVASAPSWWLGIVLTGAALLVLVGSVWS